MESLMWKGRLSTGHTTQPTFPNVDPLQRRTVESLLKIFIHRRKLVAENLTKHLINNKKDKPVGDVVCSLV